MTACSTKSRLHGPEVAVSVPVSIGPPPPVLTVVYCAWKPGLLTDESVLNFIHRALPDDNTGSGMTKPQYRPISVASDDSPFLIYPDNINKQQAIPVNFNIQ